MKSSVSREWWGGDRRGIRRLLLVTALAAVVVVLYRESFAGMVHLWRLSSYKHGYAIAPVSLYLLWLARGELARFPLVGSVAGVILAGLCVAAYMVGVATYVQVLQHFAIVSMIPALALAVLGWRSFSPVAFPLLFLLASVPAGEAVVPVLLEITGDVSAWLLSASGVPYLREGMFFSLPGGSFEIADVCSGVRYLLAGLVTAVLFAYLNFTKCWKRIAFVLLAGLAFVLANALRAYVVMVVASWSGGRVLGGRDHIYFGMVLFAAVLIGLLWLGFRYADGKRHSAATAGAGPALIGSSLRAAVLGIAGIAVLAVGPRAVDARSRAIPGAIAGIELPALSGCSEGGVWTAPWRPRMVGAAAESAASYGCGDYRAHLFVSSYSGQGQGRELAGKANEPVPTAWRRYTTWAVRDVTLADGGTLRINEATVQVPEATLVIWYWYSVNGVPVRTSAGVKVREALSAFDATPTPSSAYLIAVESKSNRPDELRAQMTGLARQLWAASAKPGPSPAAGANGD